MIIGIPKEIKNNENRVGLTPAGVQEFVKRGHDVFVQASAGENSGFPRQRLRGGRRPYPPPRSRRSTPRPR